ncbi:MAG: type II toxin-antitoxin system RelE/ParE family toxin [Candidatus Sungiibacteriota bacterium]
MPKWRFIITLEAEEDIARLDTQIRRRILDKLEWLADNFDHITPLPLSDQWRGFFKLRIGDWRVIYEVEMNKNNVIIHAIGRRDEIYR